MSWASERCKPQHISASLCFFAQRSAWRCLALSLSATQNFTIVRRSRLNRHFNSLRRVPRHIVLLRSASHSNTSQTNAPSSHAPSRSTIVPSSRLKLGLNSFRRCMSRERETSEHYFASCCSANYRAVYYCVVPLCPVLFRFAAFCRSHHRLSIVPGSRLNPGLNSFRRCMSREGDSFAAQFCSTELRYAPLS